MIQRMIILAVLCNPSWQYSHSWRTAATRKEVAKVLGQLRSILEESLPKEVASKVYLVGDELIKNSLEHGCFGIGANRKAELLGVGEFEEFLAKAEQNAAADQWIDLDLQLGPEQVLLKVRDSGAGYQLDKAINEKSPDLARLSQRGLQIAQSLSSELIVDANPTQTKAYFNLR